MKKQKNFQIATLSVLIFAVFCMAIGFAAYSQTLRINGTVNVAKSKWSVHFVDATWQQEAGSAEITTHTVTDTDINFTSRLAKPGDYCAFSIKAKNDGTFDAILDQINMSELTDAQQKYLRYTLSYGDDTFTTSAANLNTALNIDQSADVTVRVDYIQPVDAADLPSDDVTVNLSASLIYNQAQ